MRAIGEGTATLDPTFTGFMDLCLVCRACEDVCPSHVPFGRMMEAARAQIEPLRSRSSRLLRWIGLDIVLPRPWLVRIAAAVQPIARVLLPARARALVPRVAATFSRLPRVSSPEPSVEVRGNVMLLSGCVQDRWFHQVNLATIRVLTRNGWRVTVPRGQRCCGALAAHNGRTKIASWLERRNVRAFEGTDPIVVNAAGCGAHMKTSPELGDRTRDLMEFLDQQGLLQPPRPMEPTKVAYHDACHASRAQHIRSQPRRLLSRITGLDLVEVAGDERCCGAAGIYNITEPHMADQLMLAKAEALAATGAAVVASANPGCTMQIRAGLQAIGRGDIQVVHPIELLDSTRSGEPPS
jgi:glycolate oxidase iron-sulfur subunit